MLIGFEHANASPNNMVKKHLSSLRLDAASVWIRILTFQKVFSTCAFTCLSNHVISDLPSIPTKSAQQTKIACNNKVHKL